MRTPRRVHPIIGAAAIVAVLGLAGCAQAGSFTAPTPAASFAATTCPVALGSTRDVVAPPQHGDRLVDVRPAPSTALICEYGSAFDQGPGPRHTLARQVRLAAPAARRLAAAASGVRVGTSTNTAGCPSDTGSVTVIAFGFRRAPAVDLWWHTTGCQTIDDGATEAEQVANDSFGAFQTTFAAVTRAGSEADAHAAVRRRTAGSDGGTGRSPR